MPFIADAHADSLMWNRDLTRASSEGHVDFPRLKEAGVGLQCFTIVTRGFPFIGGFPLFAAYRRWPKEARRSPWTRALWQIERLEAFCSSSNGQVAVTTTRSQLVQNAEAGRVSAILGVEGGHCLEGRAARVDELYARGVRFMSPLHLSNNALGGSSFPLMGNRPLTPHGREVLDAMAKVGMAVDVAHASRRTLQDILEHPTTRPFSSHTELPDDALERIADKGGVVGIIFATPYLGGSTVEHVVRHIEHALRVMGEDGVALGSDFDGMVPLPKGMRDVRDVSHVGEALQRRGHPQRLVEKVLGGNLRRFFERLLPSGAFD